MCDHLPTKMWGSLSQQHHHLLQQVEFRRNDREKIYSKFLFGSVWWTVRSRTAASPTTTRQPGNLQTGSITQRTRRDTPAPSRLRLSRVVHDVTFSATASAPPRFVLGNRRSGLLDTRLKEDILFM